MSSFIENISPQRLGMPPHFTEWRESQLQALEDLMEDECRFSALQAPVGMGKSGIAVAFAKLTGGRAVYLTFTKALQDQLKTDFGHGHIVKGRSNFKCVGSPGNKWDCETYADICHVNSCTIGKRHNNCNAFDCDHWAGECPYRIQFQDAAQGDLTLTNYAYWVSVQNPRLESAGIHTPNHPIDLLILDEAHNAPEGLCDIIAPTITAKEIQNYASGFPKDPESVESWTEWATNEARVLAELAADNPGTGAQFSDALRRRAKFVDKLGDILNLHGEHAVETNEGHGKGGREDAAERSWSLTPVYAYQHAERRLFSGVKKVVLMSGTITPKTLSMLGLKAVDYDWHSYPYLFPKRSCPTYFVSAKNNDNKPIPLVYRTPPEEVHRIYRIAANIMRARMDRKGIVHTVSYKRAEEVLEWLKGYDMDLYRYTYKHQRWNTAERVDKFKALRSPACLVSPSVTTGYDFPGDQCEYVIVLKLPFPMSTTPVMKLRKAKDGSYPGFLMIRELVQSLGRGMRSASDHCERFIVDGSWQWASFTYKKFLPTWLTVSSRSSIPSPPPSIRERREDATD